MVLEAALILRGYPESFLGIFMFSRRTSIMEVGRVLLGSQASEHQMQLSVGAQMPPVGGASNAAILRS